MVVVPPRSYLSPESKDQITTKRGRWVSLLSPGTIPFEVPLELLTSTGTRTCLEVSEPLSYRQRSLSFRHWVRKGGGSCYSHGQRGPVRR